jgi:hypothetical protein
MTCHLVSERETRHVALSQTQCMGTLVQNQLIMRLHLASSLATLLASVHALTPPPSSFVNTAIARTVELGGATTHVTTQYNVKATEDGNGEYRLALAGKGDEEPAWWEVMVGGKAVDVGLVSAGDR